MLSISIQAGSGGVLELTINGVSGIGYISNSTVSTYNLSTSAIIPNGATYSQSGNTATYNAFELR